MRFVFAPQTPLFMRTILLEMGVFSWGDEDRYGESPIENGL